MSHRRTFRCKQCRCNCELSIRLTGRQHFAKGALMVESCPVMGEATWRMKR